MKAKMNVIEGAVGLAILLLSSIVGYHAFKTHQMQTRQNEAKTALSFLYASEKAYSVETSTFTACLIDLGFRIEKLPRFYAVGFSITAASASTCGPDGKSSCTQNFAAGFSRPCTVAKYQIDSTDQVSQLPMAPGPNEALHADKRVTSVTRNSFTAAAFGNVTSLPALDTWTINENGTLRHAF